MRYAFAVFEDNELNVNDSCASAGQVVRRSDGLVSREIVSSFLCRMNFLRNSAGLSWLM